MDNEMKRLLDVKHVLDDISPSFCAAKWTQVTIHPNGFNHSCHHPRTHKIPLEELEENPSALHNTKFKKELRKQMLNGERPEECDYCWRVEDLDGFKNNEFFSDRVTKSGSDWSLGSFKAITEGDWDQDINPAYVEISFSNNCNFKCAYCSPPYSSMWTAEIEKHGAYPTSQKFNNLEHYINNGEMPPHHKEDNPYIDAFWKWWPDMVHDLRQFRITGGEPLLSPHTFKVLDYLADNPMPNLDFSVNTNAGVSDSKMNNFISKLKHLTENNKIGVVHLFTSVDTAGKQAEYGRNGLDYDKWYSNVDKILTELPTTKITIMCTTNILSITNYVKLLEDVFALKRKHSNPKRLVPITIDVAILRYPTHQSVSILSDEYKTYMDSALQYMRDNSIDKVEDGFRDFEVARLARFVEHMKTEPSLSHGDIEVARADFYHFFNEHDKRRGTNLLETFPELENFYRLCEDTANRRII